MNLPLPEPRRSWAGLLVNSAVALIVLAVAAGMFVLSYPGVHTLALQAGVSARLARFYPALFDAVLAVACVAAIMLRDGRWWARYWAWLVIIVVLAAIGATDVAHAVNYTLPRRQTDAVVAAAPLVAVLLAFSLLLALLRHPHGQAEGPAQSRREARRAVKHPPTLPVHALSPAADEADAQAARPPAPPIALTAAAGELRTPTEPVQAVVLDPAPTRADPVPAHTEPVPAEATAEPPVPEEAQGQPAEPDTPDGQATPAGQAGPAGPGTPDGQADPAAESATPDEPGTTDRQAAPDGEPGTTDGQVAPAAESADYWEADPRLAGLAYQAEPPDADENGEPDAGTGPDEAAGEAETGNGAQRPTVDEDAPPFATAPFATIPRLNRVRATPTPPEDEED